MLLSALAVGAYGAVGSTFNFAAPLYQAIIKAYGQSDLARAQALQLRSVKMIQTMYEAYRGQPAFKAAMGMLGLDCGPNRLPLRSLSESERHSLRTDLEQMGFFEWGRHVGSTT